MRIGTDLGSFFIHTECAARTTTEGTKARAMPLWQWHSGISENSTMAMPPFMRAEPIGSTRAGHKQLGGLFGTWLVVQVIHGTRAHKPMEGVCSENFP